MGSQRFDLFHSADVRVSTNPLELATGNTAFVGATIDMTGYERCFFLLSVGELADTDATLTPLVEEELVSGGGFTAVADGDLIPDTGAELVLSDDAAGEDAVLVIGYQGIGDNVRLTVTPAANTGVIVVSVVAVLTGARHVPVIVTQAVRV